MITLLLSSKFGHRILNSRVKCAWSIETYMSIIFWKNANKIILMRFKVFYGGSFQCSPTKMKLYSAFQLENIYFKSYEHHFIYDGWFCALVSSLFNDQALAFYSTERKGRRKMNIIRTVYSYLSGSKDDLESFSSLHSRIKIYFQRIILENSIYTTLYLPLRVASTHTHLKHVVNIHMYMWVVVLIHDFSSVWYLLYFTFPSRFHFLFRNQGIHFDLSALCLLLLCLLGYAISVLWGGLQSFVVMWMCSWKELVWFRTEFALEWNSHCTHNM